MTPEILAALDKLASTEFRVLDAEAVLTEALHAFREAEGKLEAARLHNSRCQEERAEASRMLYSMVEHHVRSEFTRQQNEGAFGGSIPD